MTANDLYDLLLCGFEAVVFGLGFIGGCILLKHFSFWKW